MPEPAIFDPTQYFMGAVRVTSGHLKSRMAMGQIPIQIFNRLHATDIIINRQFVNMV